MPYFKNCIHFISFSYCLARIYSITLNKSDRTFKVSLLSFVFAKRFLISVLYQVEKYSSIPSLRVFIINKYWILWNAFSAAISCFYALLDFTILTNLLVLMVSNQWPSQHMFIEHTPWQALEFQGEPRPRLTLDGHSDFQEHRHDF